MSLKVKRMELCLVSMSAEVFVLNLQGVHNISVEKSKQSYSLSLAGATPLILFASLS